MNAIAESPTPQTQADAIVIVDDLPDNLRLLSGILNERGYKVRPAPNGARALATIRKEPPDLILLDIMMPDTDGYEVCRQLKIDKQTKDIPVIFLSALNEVLDKVKAFKTGVVDFITKPFQMEEVLVRVQTHLTLRAQQKALRQQNEELLKKNALITEQAKLLEQLATRDYLTGLSNRRDFLEKAGREVHRFERSRRPFALLLIDIDHFKQVNDTYGHDWGDKVLMGVSRCIEKTLRAQDVVARWGGEEFICLLPETDAAGATTAADKIRIGLSGLASGSSDDAIAVTATLGVSVYDGSCVVDDCIRRADEALYRGKKHGRNRVVVSD